METLAPDEVTKKVPFYRNKAFVCLITFMYNVNKIVKNLVYF